MQLYKFQWPMFMNVSLIISHLWFRQRLNVCWQKNIWPYHDLDLWPPLPSVSNSELMWKILFDCSGPLFGYTYCSICNITSEKRHLKEKTPLNSQNPYFLFKQPVETLKCPILIILLVWAQWVFIDSLIYVIGTRPLHMPVLTIIIRT